MTSRWLLVSLVAMGIAAPSFASAQQRSRTPDPQIYTDELSPRQFQREPDPDPLTERRVAPSRRVQPPSARAQALPQRQPTSYPPAQPPTQPALPARAVTCGGAFAKDSSHLKLATAYKPENIVFTEVDASEGKSLMATMLFPKDPKRRLEVWWDNETSRSGTYLIVINGQSTWSAPKGLKLGLQVAQLERLNGKPFKLKGFGSSSEEMTPTLPVQRIVRIHQAQIGFMDEGSGLEGLARLLVGQLLRGELTQLVVDERQ